MGKLYCCCKQRFLCRADTRSEVETERDGVSRARTKIQQNFMNEDLNTVYLVLDNIRSVHNVGAIFRTADAIGISKIYLCGYTPGPLDRFGRARTDFKKSALGAEKTVFYEHFLGIEEAIEKLKKEKFFIVGIEQDKRSVDYKKILPKKKTALVVGNEVDGLSVKTLSLCDEVAEIGMLGKKESINVSVALGIVLFRIFDR